MCAYAKINEDNYPALELLDNKIEENLTYEVIPEGKAIKLKYADKDKETDFLYVTYVAGSFYGRDKKDNLVEYKFVK